MSGANAPNPLGANITVDRGSSPNVTIQWSETTGYWQLTNDGVNFSRIVTLSLGGAAGGNVNNVQFNSAGSLSGSNNFNFFGGNLSVYGTNIGNGNVTATGTGQDLTLVAPNGKVYVNSVLKLSYQATAPINVSNTTQLYANTVGGGNTGLYVVNNNTTDELISKNRAVGLSLLFSY